MQVILYTTHCPKCKVLAKKIQNADITYYDEVDDTKLMIQKGFLEAPMLEVDGVIMNFKEANEWLGGLK